MILSRLSDRGISGLSGTGKYIEISIDISISTGIVYEVKIK